MKIGDVSRRIGIPASTIRYYEKVGLVSPLRRVSGRRDIDDQTIFTLEFIRLAQSAGFTIEEIKQLLAEYRADPSPNGAWNSFAAEKRVALRKKISELSQMDRVLSELLTCRCATLTECVEIGLSRQKERHDDVN